MDERALLFRISLLAELRPADAARLLPRLRDAGRDTPAFGELPEPLASQWPDSASVLTALAALEALGARFVTLRDPEYPFAHESMPDPPLSLVLRGRDRALEQTPRVAIIGARAASEAGKELAFTLARDLALAGIPVVSGLARGIDTAAHEGALSAGGTTLAVLGTGVDRCYPSENAPLFARIAETGLLVSEFPLGTAPLPLHFPRRNRILSALAEIVVVVEGTEKSGARSTVDHALDQGREVMAVPRDPFLPGSALPNRLLKDGAAPVRGVGDLLEALEGWRGTRVPSSTDTGVSPTNEPAPDTSLSGRVLAQLRGRGARLDDLAARFRDATLADLQTALLHLELAGRIVRDPVGRFRPVDGRV